jgi:mRNA interferase MazF
VVAARACVPDRGDVVWLAFTPQAGHEQAGRRSAVVLTPARYNDKSGLAICCPVTSQVKGYPFEVALPADLPVTGVILADQVRSLDWRSRRATSIARLPDDVLQDVLLKLGALLLIPAE